MHLNWTFRSALGTAKFLARERVVRFLDRRLGRPPREARLQRFVEDHAPAGDSAAALAAMDEFARQHRFLMNVGPTKGAVLRSALLQAKPQRVLEIGAYCGYSAVLIGETIAPNYGAVVSIERSRRYAAVATGIIAHAGLAQTVTVRVGTLAEHINRFDHPFDLVFLDHWKDEYLPDLRRLENAHLLRTGSIIVADNVGFFKVPDYLNHVRHGGRYDSRYVTASVEYHPNLPDGVEVSVFRS